MNIIKMQKIIKNVADILGHDEFDVVISPDIYDFKITVYDKKNKKKLATTVADMIEKRTVERIIYDMAEVLRRESEE